MSTQTVAAFINDVKFETLPEKVIKQVKTAVRDHIGVMLAAVDDTAVLAARQFAMRMGGTKESSLIGTAVKSPCNVAAMVNAIMARTLDMDDGAYRASGHLAHAGGVVIPSSLAVAECCHASGKQFIEAVAASYEVTLRAGWLISLWKMFAPAGMAGTYGAAAAAAKLFKLGNVELQDALGIAEAHCLYPSKAKRFDKMAMTKEAAGWGAMTGVSAAMLAQAGFKGPDTIFDLPEWNKEPLETLGKEWEIMRLYFKPYSSCRFTHAPLDGVFELFKKHELTADAISEITVGIAFAAAVTLFGNYRPANIWQAQFSLPFVLGAAIADGRVGPEQISEKRLSDSRILTQADKVKLVEDKEVGALASSKGMRSCRIRIATKDGSEFETFVGYPRGAPENPLSEDELSGKFLELATLAIGSERAQETLNRLNSLEDIDAVSTIVKGMCRAS
jgi:2-methylcitrate dehydratase PrpD